MDLSKVVAVGTKHGKENQIRPAFHSLLGWEVQAATVDTDRFGTFTGDVRRTLTARETVVAKARAGAQALGVSTGLASEGTIGPHPSVPFLTTITELLAFVDLDTGHEVVEKVASANIHSVSERLEDFSGFEDVANRADFPHHAVIVRTTGPSPAVIRKGITSANDLWKALEECLSVTGGPPVIVETDFRAMVCPSRHAVIEECAWKLASRLTKRCRQCASRGWGTIDYEYGLPCDYCGVVNMNSVRADVEGCGHCGYRLLAPREKQKIEAIYCDRCNP